MREARQRRGWRSCSTLSGGALVPLMPTFEEPNQEQVCLELSKAQDQRRQHQIFERDNCRYWCPTDELHDARGLAVIDCWTRVQGHKL